MIVMFPPEMEKKLIATAKENGLDPSALVVSVMGKYVDWPTEIEPLNGDGGLDANKQGIKEFYLQTGLPFSASPQEVWDKLCSLAQGEEEDPDALNRAVARFTNRTPEEREAARQELLNAIPTPLPTPEGKTVFDMIPRIRGEETEEQVFEALERLS